MSNNPNIQSTSAPNSNEAGNGNGTHISVEKLAEKVYQLMLRDIKLEQERRGNRHK